MEECNCGRCDNPMFVRDGTLSLFRDGSALFVCPLCFSRQRKTKDDNPREEYAISSFAPLGPERAVELEKLAELGFGYHETVRSPQPPKKKAKVEPSEKFPSTYRCKKCGRAGCKLWRELGVDFDVDETLRCVFCAVESEVGGDFLSRTSTNRVKAEDIDEDGTYVTADGVRCDQFGLYVPAVPHTLGFWGTTSVPVSDKAQWRSLPTKVVKPE